MALLRNLEQSLSGLVEGTVGRVLRTEVRPTEIARKLAREMEINKRVSLSRTYAPTDYIVYLSPEDRARYAGVEPSIAEELGAYLLEHARRERLVLVRRPLVEFRTDNRFRLGEFGIEARTTPISAEEAPPRAEPPASAPAPAQPEQRAPVQAVQPDPIGTPEPPPPATAIDPDLDEPAYSDPYAGDPFGGNDVAQPQDFFDHAAEFDQDEALHDVPAPAPAAPHADEPQVPHADDWLDPVDDWEAPERAEHPAPAPPVPPTPAPHPAPAADPLAGLPWVDPSLRSPSPRPQPPVVPTQAIPSPAPPSPAPAPPPPPAPPPLRVLVDGALHELHGDRAIIGRSRKVDLVISDPSVSRQHVELRRDAHGWFASDLGSTNGTLVDGQPLTTPRRLSPGSRIEVGHASAVIEVR